MQQIQIYTTQTIGAETHTANARELHDFLNSEQEYANWIKNRISQYGFIENQDYVTKIVYTGRRPRKEYFITLDMAKELCMVENNERGKEARRYFIECEKELKSLKFQEYVSQIASLTAQRKLEARHTQDKINGYKSQLVQHNKQIAVLQHELSKSNNDKTLLQHVRDERDYFRREYMRLCHLFKTDKGETIALSLAKIQKELESVYTAIGAVMSYANDNDRYFLDKNQITKDKR